MVKLFNQMKHYQRLRIWYDIINQSINIFTNRTNLIKYSIFLQNASVSNQTNSVNQYSIERL